MSRTIIGVSACCMMVALGASTATATSGDGIRSPLGVYAKIDVETAHKAYESLTPPPPPNETFRVYLDNLYETLLLDPAISGLTVGERWDSIQGADDLDWGYLDDAFSLANAKHKTVQLRITLGVDTPKSVLVLIPLCEDPFPASGVKPTHCAAVKFSGFPEEQRADGVVFPMPWDRAYNEAWAYFLRQLNDRYYVNYPHNNPAFVSIAIAGPVGASDEMIYPNSLNDTHAQPSGLDVDDTWARVIESSFPSVVNGNAYWNTDQVFIDTWGQTIATYEKIFSGITLSLIPDSGSDLPEFADNPVLPAHRDNLLFKQDCAADGAGAMAPTDGSEYLRSCEAKTEILTQFLELEAPNNAKATEDGGMTARSTAAGNIGLPGVKLLTRPLSFMPYYPPLLGGAEFDFAVSGKQIKEEGCPQDPKTGCPNLGVEDAAYYVLSAFFDGTPRADYYKAAKGPAIMRYLGVPYLDVRFAQMNLCQTESPPSTIIPNISLQDLLNRASRDLLEMAGQSSPLPPRTCPPAIKK